MILKYMLITIITAAIYFIGMVVGSERLSEIPGYFLFLIGVLLINLISEVMK